MPMLKPLNPWQLSISASFAKKLEFWSDDCRVSYGLLHGRSYDGAPAIHFNFGNHLEIVGEQIAYTPNGRDLIKGMAGEWLPDGRQSGRPAKVARSVLTPEYAATLTDKEFETFAARVKSVAVEQSGEFRVITGKDIPFWYAERHVAKASGTLDKSCMRYDQNQNFFGIYTDNPDSVSLLALINAKDRLIGRALLWNTVEMGSVMDRIYGTDATIQLFRERAIRDDMPYRAYNGAEFGWQFIKGGQIQMMKLSVVVPNWRHASYPYCDTFRYLCETGILHNDDDRRCDYRLTDTHGGPRVRRPCATCGEMTHGDDFYGGNECRACWVKTHCAYCEKVYTIANPRCDQDGTEFCVACASLYTCPECKKVYPQGLYGRHLCYNCWISHQCPQCGEWVIDKTQITNGECIQCVERKARKDKSRAAFFEPKVMKGRGERVGQFAIDEVAHANPIARDDPVPFEDQIDRRQAEILARDLRRRREDLIRFGGRPIEAMPAPHWQPDPQPDGAINFNYAQPFNAPGPNPGIRLRMPEPRAEMQWGHVRVEPRGLDEFIMGRPPQPAPNRPLRINELEALMLDFNADMHAPIPAPVLNAVLNDHDAPIWVLGDAADLEAEAVDLDHLDEGEAEDDIPF